MIHKTFVEPDRSVVRYSPVSRFTFHVSDRMKATNMNSKKEVNHG
jgi:hypothetical protein